MTCLISPFADCSVQLAGPAGAGVRDAAGPAWAAPAARPGTAEARAVSASVATSGWRRIMAYLLVVERRWISSAPTPTSHRRQAGRPRRATDGALPRPPPPSARPAAARPPGRRRYERSLSECRPVDVDVSSTVPVMTAGGTSWYVDPQSAYSRWLRAHRRWSRRQARRRRVRVWTPG